MKTKTNHRRVVLLVICIVVSIGVSVTSCTKNKESAGGGNSSNDTIVVGTVSFAATVAPIFSANCASCHGTSSPRAGIQLTNHATISANSGAAMSAINRGTMPPSGPLSTAQKANIQAWIDQGRLNN